MSVEKHSLVPLAPQSLITVPLECGVVLSSMVEETLRLAREGEKPTDSVRILFADWDSMFADVFEESFQQMGCSARHRLIRCGEADDLVQAAALHYPDVAIITLNNVFGIGSHVNDRIEFMLRLITRLKSAYRFPIIAVSGCFGSEDLPERCRLAGADLFRDRSDTEDLADIVRMYLGRDRPELTWSSKFES